jgi:GH18 family chitinase
MPLTAPRVLWSSVLVAAVLALASAACDDGLDPSSSPIESQGGPQPLAASAAATEWSVYLRTEISGQYLSAQSAGGSSVSAAGAAPREWENFHLVDANGGDLVDGDWIYLRAHDNVSYLQALNGGGAGVDVRGTSQNDWTTFQVEKVGGGTVQIGDTIALKTRVNVRYVTARDGGGSTVGATAPANRTWEHFKLEGQGGTNPPPPPPPPSGKRVIGYLPNWYGSYSSWATKIDFSRLTQVNLAFALGDGNGNLQLAPGNEIDAFVSAAHARGVKVFPSLCGGGGDSHIAPFYEPSKVDGFVDKIISFTVAHHMDGIDVDVEAPNRMGANYNNFIAKLEAKAAPRGLLVTAAVAQWMQGGMSDATLRSFDFITVMSYDATGTWTGPGAHSSYQQAVSDLNYYMGKGVARDKIVLGVPFYGYCWGSCPGGSSVYVLYKDIVARFPGSWNVDWIDTGSARWSYNGVATMKSKTVLANSYGGIMIWELGGDLAASDGHSLLRAVDDAN